MNTYLQFVRAAEANDEATISRLIREHPELHGFEGDEGGLLDLLRHNCPELFAAAFAAGLSPDAGCPTPNHTLLQHAVCESDLELVGLCLRHGADVERRNCEGETALGFAVAWASLDTVRLLVEAGADANALEPLPNGEFATALDAAFCCDPVSDRSEIRTYLLNHGAKRYSELPPSPGQAGNPVGGSGPRN